MVALGGGAVSYERGTPVAEMPMETPRLSAKEFLEFPGIAEYIDRS